MKKKLFVLLMALLMVMTMMPTTAFAALNTGHKIDVTFTILYVGDEFRIGYNYGASEKTQFVCQYTTNHSDTAYNNHTIAISDIKAAAVRATVNSGYQITGWSKESNANPTVWSLDKSGTTACNKGTTIYLVAKNPNPTPPPTPEKPVKPRYDQINEILGQNAVKVVCHEAKANHEPKSKTYNLLERSCNVGAVQGNANAGYTVEVTIASQEYISDFDAVTRKTHNPKDASESITLKYNKDSEAWKLNTANQTQVIFNVACEAGNPQPPTPTIPEKPTGDAVKGLLKNAVTVDCINTDANHADATYNLLDESFTVGKVQGSAEAGYTVAVTIQAEKYVAKYNEDLTGHTLDGEESKIITLTYNSETKSWGTPSPASVTFNVRCETSGEIDPPTDGPSGDQILELLSGKAVCVDCITTNAGHEDKYYSYNGNFTSSIVGTKCMVTLIELDEQAYIEQYNTAYSGHEKSEYQKTNSIIELEKDGLKWVIKTPARIYVECKTGG